MDLCLCFSKGLVRGSTEQNRDAETNVRYQNHPPWFSSGVMAEGLARRQRVGMCWTASERTSENPGASPCLSAGGDPFWSPSVEVGVFKESGNNLVRAASRWLCDRRSGAGDGLRDCPPALAPPRRMGCCPATGAGSSWLGDLCRSAVVCWLGFYVCKMEMSMFI